MITDDKMLGEMTRKLIEEGAIDASLFEYHVLKAPPELLCNLTMAIHTWFCNKAHPEECMVYDEQSWDDPHHQKWLKKVLHLSSALGMSIGELATAIDAVTVPMQRMPDLGKVAGDFLIMKYPPVGIQDILNQEEEEV